MHNKPSGSIIILFLLFIAVLLNVTPYCYSGVDEGLLRMHFVDVGYGDAIIIELPNKDAMLIDAGTEEYKSRLLAYINRLGIEKIDTLVITHPHANHFGGLSSLLAAKMPIRRFFNNGDTARAEKGYTEIVKILEYNNVYGKLLRRGDAIKTKIKGLKIKILSPEVFLGTANENSISMYVTYKNTSFLLTSDIQGRQEDVLIGEYPEIKQANIVQVPHHGGSVTEKFSGFFKDKIFVISTGVNKYEKPFKNDIDKLSGRVLRTDELGNIVIESNGEYVRIVNDQR